MTPMIEHYNLVVLLYWLTFLFVGVFILVQVTGFFTGEYPETFRKAVGIFLVTFAVVYFSYDLSSYFFVFLMQDPGIGFVLPPGFGYWNWLREPLAVKWQVLGFVPFIRFFPILFALIMGGVAQVFLWTVPYRVGAVIFLAQVFLDLVAMTLLSYAFSWGIVIYERAVQKPERPRPAPQHFPEGELDQAAPGNLPHLAHRVRNLAPEQGTFWRQLENDWDAVNRHLHPLYALFSPVTRHLPLPAQDFLDSGGWVLVLFGVGALGMSWRRVDRHRKGYVEHRKRNPPRHRHIRIELAFVGDAMTDLGPRQVTVRGVPARLRLVVLAPTAKGAEGVGEQIVALTLNHVLPGLSEIVKSDVPRLEFWNSQHAQDNFREALTKRVVFPEAAPSHWVLLCGEAMAGSAPVHVGLALYTKSPAKPNIVEVPAGKWSELLALRKVSEDERVLWPK